MVGLYEVIVAAVFADGLLYLVALVGVVPHILVGVVEDVYRYVEALGGLVADEPHIVVSERAVERYVEIDHAGVLRHAENGLSSRVVGEALLVKTRYFDVLARHCLPAEVELVGIGNVLYRVLKAHSAASEHGIAAGRVPAAPAELRSVAVVYLFRFLAEGIAA